MAYDVIDGGIPATFLDGPKAGHVGVVDPDDDVPPATLDFMDGRLIYVRHSKHKIRALDAEGQAQRYRGVAYKVDKRCPFMVQMRFEIAKSKAELAAGRVDVQ